MFGLAKALDTSWNTNLAFLCEPWNRVRRTAIIPGLLVTALPGHRADNGEHQSRFKLCFWAREQWPFHSTSGIWLSPASGDLVRQAGHGARWNAVLESQPQWEEPRESRGKEGAVVARSIITRVTGAPNSDNLHWALGHFYNSTLSLTTWQEESIYQETRSNLALKLVFFLLKCSYRSLASRNNWVFLETLHRYMLT